MSAAQNQVSRIDGQTDQVETVIPAGRMPEGIDEADGDIWVSQPPWPTLRDRCGGSMPETSRVLERIRRRGHVDCPGRPQSAGRRRRSRCGSASRTSAYERRSGSTRSGTLSWPPSRSPSGGVCGQLIADDEAVWVGSGFCGDGNLTRIDPSTNEVEDHDRVTPADHRLRSALGFGSVWITTDAGPFEIDPATNEVASRTGARRRHRQFGGDLGGGQHQVRRGSDDAQDQARDQVLDPTAP